MHRPTSARATVLCCVHCGQRLRWKGERSAKVRCPRCQKRLIVRRGGDERWTVLPENDDSVAGMICDWLGRGGDDRE